MSLWLKPQACVHGDTVMGAGPFSQRTDEGPAGWEAGSERLVCEPPAPAPGSCEGKEPGAQMFPEASRGRAVPWRKAGGGERAGGRACGGPEPGWGAGGGARKSRETQGPRRQWWMLPQAWKSQQGNWKRTWNLQPGGRPGQGAAICATVGWASELIQEESWGEGALLESWRWRQGRREVVTLGAGSRVCRLIVVGDGGQARWKPGVNNQVRRGPPAQGEWSGLEKAHLPFQPHHLLLSEKGLFSRCWAVCSPFSVQQDVT